MTREKFRGAQELQLFSHLNFQSAQVEAEAFAYGKDFPQRVVSAKKKKKVLILVSFTPVLQ